MTIPVNMDTILSSREYVCCCSYMEELVTNKEDWDDLSLAKEARKLWDEIEAGIQSRGIAWHEKYVLICAYEVYKLGNYILMDDANIPNGATLGYHYDPEIYEDTDMFILSHDNPTFHRGKNYSQAK